MKTTFLFSLLLAGLVSAGPTHAQTTADSLRQRGELTGARPSGDLPAKSRPRSATVRATSAGAVQQHLLASDVNLTHVNASQLPDLYERFIGTTRDERRQWTSADWDAAGQVLAHLNQRYAQVRTELPLEERLRIRAFQGEFRTLRGTRQLSSRA